MIPKGGLGKRKNERKKRREKRDLTVLDRESEGDVFLGGVVGQEELEDDRSFIMRVAPLEERAERSILPSVSVGIKAIYRGL